MARLRVGRGPDPKWLDPSVEGYQGACAKRLGAAVCRCPRCEPRPTVGYTTLGCGCVLDGPGGAIMFIHPECLGRASAGRAKTLASAGSRADQQVLERRVMALHDLDRGRAQPTSRGFSSSGLKR